jgi:hypothetical protein
MPFRSSDSLLPLTPIAFEILLALAEEDRHGYAILQAVEGRLRGKLPLRTGHAVPRAGQAGRGRADRGARLATGTDSRRRTYRLTKHWPQHRPRETERMADQVAAARSRRLIPGRP